MRAVSLETLLHMTAAALGITLIPALALRGRSALPQHVVAKPLTGGQAFRRVRLVSRASNPRRLAIEALAALVKDCAPSDLTAAA